MNELKKRLPLQCPACTVRNVLDDLIEKLIKMEEK